jgi:hypothetical protein
MRGDSMDPNIRASGSRDGQNSPAERSLTLRLDGFAWEALEEEAAQEGLAIEELVTFSVLYYLADLDGGRISRRISRSPYPLLLDDRLKTDADRRSAKLSAPPITDRE